jgi:hypothetical protein
MGISVLTSDDKRTAQFATEMRDNTRRRDAWRAQVVAPTREKLTLFAVEISCLKPGAATKPFHSIICLAITARHQTGGGLGA